MFKTKKVVWWNLLAFCGLYFALAGVSYADEDFIYGLIMKSYEFTSSESARRTDRALDGRPLSNDDFRDHYVEYYQGKDSVAVMIPEGGESSYAYFATKDKKLVFPGNVRVGGPISAALKPGLVPGELNKGEDGGIVVYAWDSGTYLVVISAMDDIIQHVSFFEQEPLEAIKIDPQLVTFLP